MGIVTAEDMEGLVELTAEEKVKLGFKPGQPVFNDQNGRIKEFEAVKVADVIPLKQLYFDVDTTSLSQEDKDKITEILRGPLIQKMTDSQMEELVKLCMCVQKLRYSSRNIMAAKQLKVGDKVLFAIQDNREIGGRIGKVKEIKKNFKVVVDYDNRGYIIPASMLLLVDPNYQESK